MTASEQLVLYAVYLEDGGVERRAALRHQVPQVGDRLWAQGREWIVQRRRVSADALCDVELEAVARLLKAG
ncbi:MAG: hypothetical protein WD689_08625 [Gaiellaceae bacterium]